MPARSLPWDRMFFFWGDERHVPPTDPDSNYRMADETMLSKIPVAAGNVFRIRSGESRRRGRGRSLRKNSAEILSRSKPGQFPRFDLILLGMGPDGHTASLFPGTAGLQEKSRLVIANWVEKFKTSRLTFTLPVLNAAAWWRFWSAAPTKPRRCMKCSKAMLRASSILPSWFGRRWKLIWLIDRAAPANLVNRTETVKRERRRGTDSLTTQTFGTRQIGWLRKTMRTRRRLIECFTAVI